MTSPIANPYTPTLHLDHQARLPDDLTPFVSPSRGIRISLDGRTALILPPLALTAIDIVAGPSLQLLDLSRLVPGRVNLSVMGCSQLQEVRFGDQASGHLFYHAEASLPEMTLHGGITYIDMGWQKGDRSLRISADVSKGWNGVQIRYDPKDFSSLPVGASALWVLIHQSLHGDGSTWAPQNLSLPPDRHQRNQPVDLYVEGVLNIETFQWNGNSLRSLELHRFPGLRSVELHAPVESVLISDAANLASVLSTKGVGQLKIDNASLVSEKLVVQASYQSLQLTNSAKTLEVLGDCCAPVALEWCGELTSVSLPPGAAVRCQGCAPDGLALNAVNYYVNENVLQVLLGRIEQGDHTAWEKLRRLVPYCAQGTKLKAALSTLARLGQFGIPESEIWETRLCLNFKNRHPNSELAEALTPAQRQKTLQTYEWTMPKDLYNECWRQEWNILDTTFATWGATSYAKIIYSSIAENDTALIHLRAKLGLRPAMTEIAKRIALGVLERVQNTPLNTGSTHKNKPSIALMAESLLHTLQHLPQKDKEAENLVKESLFNTLDGNDLENFIAKELLIDPVKMRLRIMRRVRALEKTRSYSDHVKRLKQLLLGGTSLAKF